GCYVFQVTAPPGGGPEVLLSHDSIHQRFIEVSGGLLVHDTTGACAAAAAALTDCGPLGPDPGSCTPTGDVVNNNGPGDPGHDAGVGKCSGTVAANISVRLMPYCDTTNPGGVYKAYVTPVSAYDNTCGGVFGFIHDNSKTDNFRVRSTETPPPPQQGEIRLFKVCDADADGFLDPAELVPGLPGWQLAATNASTCSGMTDMNGQLDCSSLDPATYSVDEIVQSGFAHTATCVDGFCGTCSVTTTTACNDATDCPTGESCNASPLNPVSVVVAGGETHTADFGNVGLSQVTGRKFDDRNANGTDDSESGIGGVKVLLHARRR